MTISVVIPTYNEEKNIATCLDSVLAGSLLPDEIIIADGNSTDRTIEVAGRYPSVQVVENKLRHAAGGRNAGIQAANGELIVFLDADCIADRDWLQEIHNAFLQEELDGCGACILPFPSDNRCEQFWGHLSLQLLMNYGDQPYYVKNKTLNEAFITASCAYTKDLLTKLNYFSNYFANNAEDIDLCWRALEAGAKLKYIPSAKILAHSPTTVAGICKKSFRNGISSSKLQKTYSNSRINFDKYLYKALGKNLIHIFKKDEFADLFVVELVFHLLGKYYGSIRYGVINI